MVMIINRMHPHLRKEHTRDNYSTLLNNLCPIIIPSQFPIRHMIAIGAFMLVQYIKSSQCTPTPAILYRNEHVLIVCIKTLQLISRNVPL